MTRAHLCALLARVNFTVHVHRAVKPLQALRCCGSEVALATKNIAGSFSTLARYGRDGPRSHIQIRLWNASFGGHGRYYKSSTALVTGSVADRREKRHECFRKNHGRNFRTRVSAGGECITHVSAWHHVIAQRYSGEYATNGRRCCDRRQGGSGKGRETCLANLDCRPDESARSRQQPERAKGTRERTELYRRHQRHCQNECLVAQAGHGETRGQWRQAAGRHQDVN